MNDVSKHCGSSAEGDAQSRGVPTAGRVIYRIENMDCPTEEALIRKRLAGLPQVLDLEFDLPRRTLAVRHTLPSTTALEAALADVGMKAVPFTPSAEPQTTVLRIDRMDRPEEEGSIRRTLAAMGGVVDLHVDLAQRCLTLRHAPESLPAILAALKSIGFDAERLGRTDDTSRSPHVSTPPRNDGDSPVGGHGGTPAGRMHRAAAMAQMAFGLSSSGQRGTRTAARWWALALVVAAVDQITKLVVETAMPYRQVIRVLDIFNLVHARNTGAAFSFLADAAGWQRPFFIVLALGVSLWLALALRERMPALQAAAYSFILGGAIANAIDRITRGYVVDYLDVHWRDWHWPAFNVADIGITCGAALLIASTFRKPKAGAVYNDD